MGLLDLFSRRNKPLPDVFQYDVLPDGLRRQIVHILQDTLPSGFSGGTGWKDISRMIACEHELLELPGRRGRYGEKDHRTDCLNYILQAAETEMVLDMVEVCFKVMEYVGARGEYLERRPEDAIDELNQRFRMHGVGYQYVNLQIIRVDSQLLHAEAVIPALRLLHAEAFKGPNEEFLSAHEHFRHGRNEEAIVDAGKAFESTMKVICDARKWTYDKNKATASTLIGIILTKMLIPTWSEEQLRNLEKCLTGLATVRNRNAHGAGGDPRDVPAHLAAYALHLAASNIVFLVESFNAMK